MPRRHGLFSLLGVLALTACTYAPPPPLVERTTTTPTATPVDLTEIVVGVDSLAGDFNPHTLPASASANTSVAGLVLPSVFRPSADGTPVLDTALVTAVTVTSTEPFVVEYAVNRAASWSDGAPIAAEDFVYLWQRMRSEPGVADPAGYRQISGITARDGGKTVVVTFSRAYPGWRSLFTNLLPSHLLKDAPGGWATAFADGLPVSGHRFSVKTVDRDRHEIVLERNDRYWHTPVLPNRVVLRESDHRGVVEALRRGDAQVALLRADAITARMLTGLGTTISTRVAPRPVITEVVLRPAGPHLADQATRQAIASLIDRDSLIAIGTGSGPSTRLRADAQVLAPSQPGYRPTIPAEGLPGLDRAAAERLLVQAGYQRVRDQWVKDGRPLEVTVGSPRYEPYQTLAVNVRRQLAEAGVAARMVDVDDRSVLGAPAPTSTAGPTPTGATATADNRSTLDIVVIGRPVARDPATGLASEFGCPAPLAGLEALPAPNPAGFCDPMLQPTIDAALSGDMPLDQALGVLEPALWRQAVVIPLYQEADTLIQRPEITGIAPGTIFAGPLTSAGDWRRQPVAG